jgi:hypothetical protein
MSVWSILWLFGIYNVHLKYFVINWYTIPYWGMWHQEKSGNPASRFVQLRVSCPKGPLLCALGAALLCRSFSDLMPIHCETAYTVLQIHALQLKVLFKDLKLYTREGV